jgi:sulfide:quinone oxidoreductase
VITPTIRAYAHNVSKPDIVHHRSKILIAGAGVAGLEALLALRSLLGGTADIEMLSPELEFSYGPIAVAEPFGLGEVRRLELARIAAEHGAHLRQGALVAVDASEGLVQTDRGESLEYDFLIVATGARQHPALEGAVTFGGRGDREALASVLMSARDGTVRRLLFVAPTAVAWLLPLYELALFTSAWARQRDIRGLELTLVTYESRALEVFGLVASDGVAQLLADSAVTLITGKLADKFDGRRLLLDGARALPADAVVALPGLDGPGLPGLPHDEHGFIPTDPHGAVRGVRRVYAAGDGTAFPIKQGGLAAQQADAVAAAIAAEIGAVEHPEPFRPVLRGVLLTGAEPRYLRAASSDQDEEISEVAFAPLWWPPGKIAGRHLAPYLARPGDPELMHSTLTDRPAPAEPETSEQAREEEREAVELLLELADANARRGSFDFAVKCLDAAEDVGGPLPAAKQRERREWEQLAR